MGNVTKVGFNVWGNADGVGCINFWLSDGSYIQLGFYIDYLQLARVVNGTQAVLRKITWD